MLKFKVHAHEEVSIGSTICRDKISDLPMTSSGLIFSSSLRHHPPDSKTRAQPLGDLEYSAQFLGKFEVPPPSSSKDTQVQTIDKLVVKLKETHQLKMSKGKKGLSSLWRGKLTSSSLRSSSTETVSPSSSSSLRSSSTETVSPEGDKQLRTNLSVDSQPPPPVFSITGENGSTGHVQNGGVTKQISEQEIASQVNDGTMSPNDEYRRESVTSEISMDFDTIPELSSLQDTPVFQSLCGSQATSQRVRLVFSGMVVMLVCQETGERLLKKSIRNIACCAQVMITYVVSSLDNVATCIDTSTFVVSNTCTYTCTAVLAMLCLYYVL